MIKKANQYAVALTIATAPLTVLGCVSPTAPTFVQTMPHEMSSELETWAKTQVSQRGELRDPDSAQFRNLFARIDNNGVVYVCGDLNAKNGYGAYTGYEPFYVSAAGAIWIPDRYTPASFIRDGHPVCH